MQGSYETSLFSGFEEQLKCVFIQQIILSFQKWQTLEMTERRNYRIEIYGIYIYLQLLLNKMHSEVVKM